MPVKSHKSHTRQRGGWTEREKIDGVKQQQFWLQGQQDLPGCGEASGQHELVAASKPKRKSKGSCRVVAAAGAALQFESHHHHLHSHLQPKVITATFKSYSQLCSQ
jgi:hypothetical protein